MSIPVCGKLQGAVVVILVSIPVCGKLQGAVVVILYVYTCLWQITGGSGGNHVCLYLFVAN